LRTNTRLTLALLLLLRASVCAFTLTVSHAPMWVECLFSMTLPPEHERHRKDEKRWARAECDPIKIFEESADATRVDLKACKAKAKGLLRTSS